MSKSIANVRSSVLFALLHLLVPSTDVFAQSGVVSGELKQWHRATITFDGPAASEEGSPNPFLDYRLQVRFTGPDNRVFDVPGFFAADGDAANTSASSGNKWRVHFAPHVPGLWQYVASFRTGDRVAVSTDPAAGAATSFDGAQGTLAVGPTDKSAPDFRAKGLLRYVGARYLQFAHTGEYFLKGGADSPENFLAYHEFDDTYDTGGAANDLVNGLHRYSPHVGDWRAGDPQWKNGLGRGIIGALNYLAGKGMNSVYFLTYNIDGGDGAEVWPWTSHTARLRYDVSKLDQWETVFSHMDRLGLQLHVVTQETENDQGLDGGALGDQRNLYYRELIARFSHHLAVNWNLGEENTNTDAERRAFASRIRLLDPYDHQIVVHTFPNGHESVYAPLLGFPDFEGPSIQTNAQPVIHGLTIQWLDRSTAAGRPWVVTLDESGGAGSGVRPDANDPNHDNDRKNYLWANLMAGGAGVEWYFGYNYPNADLDAEDWRSRDRMWDQTRHALNFFRQHLPYHEMQHADQLTTATDDYVFAKTGSVYAIYLPNGGTTSLDLGTSHDTFTVSWFNPRTGEPLVSGSVASVPGPGVAAIGTAPGAPGQDWVALVRSSTGTGGLPSAPTNLRVRTP